ncbi:MAG: hypothetical protein ACR2LE_01600 [Nocardioidaceae bacterium]
MDDESDWVKQVLVGVGVLLVVAAGIGGLIGLVGIKAADFAGITSEPTHARETMVLGPGGPSTRPSPSPSPSPTRHSPRTSAPATTSHPPERSITLKAAPTSAATYERVTLSGTCPAAACSTLQVQRKEGNVWVDFPTQASGTDGNFSTYIQTGHTGDNLFRVQETSTGKVSPPVTVTIG